MTIRFDDRVAIVTGSGNGLGKSHALQLARLGAKVLVNDIGGARDGTGGSLSPAQAVVAEIKLAGGEAMANTASVTNAENVSHMVDQAMNEWGRVDILINNAGILRDRSFGNMSQDEWHNVVDVHLNGTANCSMAVWKIMKKAELWPYPDDHLNLGNLRKFWPGELRCGKMGAIGLMNTLCIEGAKNNIRVNCLAPTAATRMTQDVINEKSLVAINPEKVSPAAIYMVSENGPNRIVMLAGAGSFATLEIRESGGLHLPDDQCNGDGVAANFAKISEMTNTSVFTDGGQHVVKILAMNE